MKHHAITLLGTGLIGDFYTMTLHGQRGRDRVQVVYSRSEARARAFSERWSIPEITTDMEAAIRHPETDVVIVALPNFLHEEAVTAVAAAGKAVLCTKPLGRTADEAQRMLEAVEKAGVFGGYLEDLCYTPKTLKAVASVEGGAMGDVTWVRSRETHPGPAQRLVLGRAADGRRRDHRPRLPLHRDHPQLRRQGKPAGRGHVHDRHARPPDRRRGQRDRADPVRVGGDRPVRGQLDVPRRHGPARRGRGHARHDLAQPLPAHGLRDVHRGRRRAATWPRRPRRRPAGCFPVGDEVSELGYVDMFSDMFDALDGGGTPRETLYDGYVVNAVMDACYRSAKSRGWEPVELFEWRGGATPRIAKSPETYDGQVVIKRELLPDGREKLILKDPATGDFTDRVTTVR